MHCERMMIGESLIILFMFAYQILMNTEMKATLGRGLPQLKKKMWLGFQQKKKENLAETLAKNKRKCG